MIEQNWVTPVELMDSLYLSYIITEKRYGVSLANEALADIERAKDLLPLRIMMIYIGFLKERL